MANTAQDYVCSNCGSDTVQQLKWVEMNTDKVIDAAGSGGSDDADYYCVECELHLTPIPRQQYDEANQPD
jgi:DNA-directed RNA polymerase subunit RPC12/RpoP